MTVTIPVWVFWLLGIPLAFAVGFVFVFGLLMIIALSGKGGWF